MAMEFNLGDRVMIENGPHKDKTGILVKTPNPYDQVRVEMDNGTGHVDIFKSGILEYPKVYPLQENFTVNVRDDCFWYMGTRAVTRSLVEVLATTIVRAHLGEPQSLKLKSKNTEALSLMCHG
jgi:hypothetical protein